MNRGIHEDCVTSKRPFRLHWHVTRHTLLRRPYLAIFPLIFHVYPAGISAIFHRGPCSFPTLSVTIYQVDPQTNLNSVKFCAIEGRSFFLFFPLLFSETTSRFSLLSDVSDLNYDFTRTRRNSNNFDWISVRDSLFKFPLHLDFYFYPYLLRLRIYNSLIIVIFALPNSNNRLEISNPHCFAAFSISLLLISC